MRRLIAACTAIALLAAGSVAAQVPGTRYTPTMPRVDMTTRYGASAAENQDRFARALVDPSRQASDPNGERREGLIERLWPLVAEGKCNEARRIARAEGDRPVSRRIGEICVEGRPTTAPEAASPSS